MIEVSLIGRTYKRHTTYNGKPYVFEGVIVDENAESLIGKAPWGSLYEIPRTELNARTLVVA